MHSGDKAFKPRMVASILLRLSMAGDLQYLVHKSFVACCKYTSTYSINIVLLVLAIPPSPQLRYRSNTKDDSCR